MVNFYITNQFFDKDNKLQIAGKNITIEEERAVKLAAKNYGYIVGKVEVKEKNKK
jgi:hypothetical protein